MAPSSVRPFLRTIALVLALTMASTGCAATSSSPRFDGTLVACAEEDAATIRTARTGGSTLATVAHEAGAERGLVRTHGGGGAAAMIFVLGLLIGFVIAVDLLILPFTAPRDASFTCTRSIVRHCCH